MSRSCCTTSDQLDNIEDNCTSSSEQQYTDPESRLSDSKDEEVIEISAGEARKSIKRRATVTLIKAVTDYDCRVPDDLQTRRLPDIPPDFPGDCTGTLTPAANVCRIPVDDLQTECPPDIQPDFPCDVAGTLTPTANDCRIRDDLQRECPPAPKKRKPGPINNNNVQKIPSCVSLTQQCQLGEQVTAVNYNSTELIRSITNQQTSDQKAINRHFLTKPADLQDFPETIQKLFTPPDP